VDVTIGMNDLISDDSAILFAEGFYGALAARETVATAFDHGVARLKLEDRPDAMVPVLRIRPGVDPKTVFQAWPRRGDSGHGALPGFQGR
jgi:hypothetical protein